MMAIPSTPRGLAVMAACFVALVGFFAWFAGYSARSPSSAVASGTPLLLAATAVYAVLATFLLYSAARRIQGGTA
jgi:membrane protein implicated in regulation of membrane protease activity